MGVEIVGWAQWGNGGATRLQWVVPGMPREELMSDAFLIAPSVQDVVNFRSAGCSQPAVAIPFLESSAKCSKEPLVVKQGDQTASLQVWGALNEGRPVIYPEQSAYYEQVFHAGLSYGEGEDPAPLAEQARCIAEELRGLRYLPSPHTTQGLVRVLLASAVSKASFS